MAFFICLDLYHKSPDSGERQYKTGAWKRRSDPTWKVEAPLWCGAISKESVPSAEISGLLANSPARPPGSCTSEKERTWHPASGMPASPGSALDGGIAAHRYSARGSPPRTTTMPPPPGPVPPGENVPSGENAPGEKLTTRAPRSPSAPQGEEAVRDTASGDSDTADAKARHPPGHTRTWGLGFGV